MLGFLACNLVNMKEVLASNEVARLARFCRLISLHICTLKSTLAVLIALNVIWLSEVGPSVKWMGFFLK